MNGSNLGRAMAGIAVLAAFTISGHAPAAPARAPASAADHFASPWPLTDTFEGEPPRARAVPGSACVTAERYVVMVAAQRWGEIGSLFAEDAVYLPPDGPALRGRAAIAPWFAKGQPVAMARPLAFTASGRECFMEIAGKKAGQGDGRWRIVAIDHFTMNSRNQIVRAIYYFRPQTLLGRPMVPADIPPATGK